MADTPFDPETFEVNPTALEGITVVITGKLTQIDRKQAEALVERAGGKATGSISSKTNLLVAGEKAGSKLQKAEKLGIEVLDEEGFLARIGMEEVVTNQINYNSHQKLLIDYLKEDMSKYLEAQKELELDIQSSIRISTIDLEVDYYFEQAENFPYRIPIEGEDCEVIISIKGQYLGSEKQTGTLSSPKIAATLLSLKARKGAEMGSIILSIASSNYQYDCVFEIIDCDGDNTYYETSKDVVDIYYLRDDKSDYRLQWDEDDLGDYSLTSDCINNIPENYLEAIYKVKEMQLQGDLHTTDNDGGYLDGSEEDNSHFCDFEIEEIIFSHKQTKTTTKLEIDPELIKSCCQKSIENTVSSAEIIITLQDLLPSLVAELLSTNFIDQILLDSLKSIKGHATESELHFLIGRKNKSNYYIPMCNNTIELRRDDDTEHIWISEKAFMNILKDKNSNLFENFDKSESNELTVRFSSYYPALSEIELKNLSSKLQFSFICYQHLDCGVELWHGYAKGKCISGMCEVASCIDKQLNLEVSKYLFSLPKPSLDDLV